jgi:hypothetical protein
MKAKRGFQLQKGKKIGGLTLLARKFHKAWMSRAQRRTVGSVKLARNPAGSGSKSGGFAGTRSLQQPQQTQRSARVVIVHA